MSETRDMCQSCNKFSTYYRCKRCGLHVCQSCAYAHARLHLATAPGRLGR